MGHKHSIRRCLSKSMSLFPRQEDRGYGDFGQWRLLSFHVRIGLWVFYLDSEVGLDLTILSDQLLPLLPVFTVVIFIGVCKERKSSQSADCPEFVFS